MVEYYCKACDIKTDLSVCPSCHQRTDLKGSSIFWCEECHIPLYDHLCPLCGKKAKRIATDIRPVFPEERLLMEIVLGEPLKYKDCSVWSSASNFYLIDGKRIDFNITDVQKIGADILLTTLSSHLGYYSLSELYTFAPELSKFRRSIIVSALLKLVNESMIVRDIRQNERNAMVTKYRIGG